MNEHCWGKKQRDLRVDVCIYATVMGLVLILVQQTETRESVDG